MSQPKPKLLIVGGPGIPAEELSRCLREQFDVVVEPPGPAATGRLRDRSIRAVVAGAQVLPEIAAHPAVLLLDAIGEGVCLADSAGKEIWANDRFRALSEETRERVRQCCEQAVEAILASAAMVNGDEPPTCKFALSDPREQIAHDVFIQPAGEETDDSSLRLAVVVRDVSTERRLAQRMSAIDRAGAELIGLEAESVRKSNSAERLKALEGRIVRVAHDLLRFDHFLIRLIDERTRRLEPVISVGLPQEAVDLELLAEEEGNGISGYVAATGRSVVCADVHADERFMPGLGDARSSLTVPLRLHEKVIGVMNVESREAAAFNEEDRQFCEIFARYIAISLHMLDLLVVERSTTNLSISGRMEGELRDCLEDILSEAEWLTGAAARDPETARHIARIKADVESIRARVRNMAAGPQTLLGVERALADRTEDPVLRGKRVLVADDESKIRRIIRDVLRSRGCVVETCESGSEAIEKLTAASAERFDIVISDIKMPDRNGYQVFAAAREAMPDVPVILMTGFGYDPHHSIVRASQEGLQSVLFKPFQIERLIDEARKALGGK